MENKINIAEILKDCPKGTELYSPIFGECTLEVAHTYNVVVNYKSVGYYFYNDGSYIKGGECLLFPSKDQRDWSKFQKHFKDGDILTSKTGKPFILKAYLPEINNVWSYCGIDYAGNFKESSDNWTYAKSVRFATEKEKEILFQAIKENGYKWNAETKTLEKLKKEKFDITTLIPFESKVLVRDYDHTYWRVSFFGVFDKDECIYDTVRGAYKQCIPFKNNEHLLGKTDDCDEFYKTWE